MHVQEDVPLWQVDGVLAGEYAPFPPSPLNEHGRQRLRDGVLGSEDVSGDQAPQRVGLQLVLRSGLAPKAPRLPREERPGSVECSPTRVDLLLRRGVFSFVVVLLSNFVRRTSVLRRHCLCTCGGSQVQ